MARRSATITAGLLILALLALAGGCSSSSKPSLARSLNPHEADHLLALQKARERMGENQEDEVKPDPARLEGHADGLARQGDWSGALFQYGRAIGLAEPAQQRRVRFKMAELSLQARMYVPAERIFLDLAKDAPADAAVQQGLGLALLGQQRHQEARERLLAAARTDPALWRAFNGLGVLADREGRPREAVEHFSLAIARRPDVAYLYNNLGMAYLMLGDLGRAETSLRKALTLDPAYGLASNNLGLVLAQRGRAKEALRAFEKGSGPAQAHNNLGAVMAWKGDYNKAADYFEQAREIMPRYYPLAERHLELMRERIDGAPSPASPAMVPAPAYNAQDLPRVELPPEPVPAPAPAAAPMSATAPVMAPTLAPASYAPARGPVQAITLAPVSYAPPAAPKPAPLRRGPIPVELERPASAEAPAPAPALVPGPASRLEITPPAPQPATAPQAAPAKPAGDPSLAKRFSAKPGQGLPVGFIGFITEKDETHFVEGLAVDADGRLHRLQGHTGSLGQGIAVGPGGDAGEGHRAQAVAGSQGQ
jgi:Flp pilus assembly protein TadD